jgi:hypothetical protein
MERARFIDEAANVSQKIVNLRLAHKLLTAANEQPYGFLKVRGSDLAREVELMASAGLVDASDTVRGSETYAVINRLTDAGYSFLRAFRSEPLLPSKAPIVRRRNQNRAAKKDFMGLIPVVGYESLRYFLEKKCETGSSPGKFRG